MFRNLKIVGVAMAVFAFTALAASSAMAKDIGTHNSVFTASVGAEKAKIDGTQIGAGDRFTVNGLSLTCVTATLSGTALTSGTSSESVTLEPTYKTCHVVVAGLTKTVLVTTNGCAYIFHAKTTTTEATATTFDNTATVTLECPEGVHLEIHVYNKKELAEESLCTYTVTPGHLGTIPLDNKINTPSGVNDIVATPNFSFSVDNDIKSAICGQNAIETATYKGEDTIQATTQGGTLVHASISD
jgi:hypothetical protein